MSDVPATPRADDDIVQLTPPRMIRNGPVVFEAEWSVQSPDPLPPRWWIDAVERALAFWLWVQVELRGEPDGGPGFIVVTTAEAHPFDGSMRLPTHAALMAIGELIGDVGDVNGIDSEVWWGRPGIANWWRSGPPVGGRDSVRRAGSEPWPISWKSPVTSDDKPPSMDVKLWGRAIRDAIAADKRRGLHSTVLDWEKRTLDPGAVLPLSCALLASDSHEMKDRIVRLLSPLEGSLPAGVVDLIMMETGHVIGTGRV